MSSSNSVRLAVSFAIACAASVAAPTWAADAEELTLEEVIVTAERREMALQDTPISIVALSAETMEQKGVEDLMDMALYTPNLAIQGSRGTGNNQPSFIIRGISGGGGATSERGVALYIDGIYVPRTSGSVFKVFDLERAEVLRGPQGTLFGRNSTGGAIRLITKQPTQEFESYLKATLGNFSRRDISGMINVPLSDTAALRVQAAYLNQDGYVRRGPQLLGGSEDILGRVQLALNPTDDLKITIGGMYSDSKSDGNPADLETFDMLPNLSFQGNYADWISDSLALAGQPRLNPDNDPRIVLNDFTMPDFCLIDDFNPDWDDACLQRNDNKYYQGDVNVQLRISDNISFTSVTGASKLDHVGNTDWQLLGFEIRPDDVASKVFYQEFQLNAALAGGKIDLVTGLNYFAEKSRSATRQLTRRGTSTYSATGGSPNGNGDAGLFVTANTDVTQKANAFGWFNNLTWHVNDKFNITGGLRLSLEKKDYLQTRFAASDFIPAPGTTSTTVTADDSWSTSDWRLTADYHFTDDFMTYATVSKAFRAGAYSYNIVGWTAANNATGPAQSPLVLPIPPERVINMELGARATMFGGRLRFNPTGYFMEWTNRQGAQQRSCVTEGIAACPTGFRIVLVNSGDVDVYGLELDTQFVVTRNLSLDGSLGTSKFQLRDPVANTGPNLFPSQATPTWNVGATWSSEIAGGGLTANLSYASVGDQETHPTGPVFNAQGVQVNDSFYRMPGYGLMNARLQWTSSDGRNVISLFGNNLLDEVYGNFATRFGGGFWDSGSAANTAPAGVGAATRSARSVVRGRPREIGIGFQHNFQPR